MRPSRFLMTMFASLVVLAGAPPSSSAQAVSTIYNFSGQNSSGNPLSVVPEQGRDGKLYGTSEGPLGSDGSIFKLTPSGLESQPYTFGSDGVSPSGGLTLGADGSFYGTTYYGGSSGNGVLFKISPGGVYTVLHEFSGGTDGAIPEGPPLQASDGNFYGATSGTSEASTIYEYSTDGSFSTIYNFSSLNGQDIVAPIIEGTDGNLYGTAAVGGASSCGTLFKVTKAGALLWSYSFNCGTVGGIPISPLLQAADGNFYGTTFRGGIGIGCGTVFKLDQAGNVSLLYAFKNAADGCDPEAGLTQGTDGNFYGTTPYGGKGANGGNGTLFQLSTSGKHTILYNLGATGYRPFAAPMQDTNGIFYGTTEDGGESEAGTVYSLNMGLGPFVTFVQPTAAVGGTAQILGQGLTGTTSVTFNGVASTSIKIVNDTYITAAVPAGATTGKVVVTTPGGPLTSNVNFRILQ